MVNRNRFGRQTLKASAVVLLTLVAGPGALAGPGGTAPEFGESASYAIGADPSSVAIADVTGDGRNDVLMGVGGRVFDLNPNEYSLVVLPQQEDGTLGLPQRLPSHDAPGGHDPMGVSVGDLNRDGLADAAMGTNAGIDVYLQGPAGLLPPVLIPTKDMVTQVIIGDMEGDDAGDLLAATAAQIIYYKHLHGQAWDPVIVSETSADEIEMADVTGGDYKDVVAYSGSTLRVYRSHLEAVAPGTKLTYFEPVHEYTTGNPEYLGAGLAVGDVTGDGLNDVALSIGGGADSASMMLFPQIPLIDLPEGTKTLGEPVPFPAAASPGASVAADLDGDERAEIVTLHSEHMGVFRSSPGGALSDECLREIPGEGFTSPKSVAIGDVNSDGLQDVAIATIDGVMVMPQTDRVLASSVELSVATSQAIVGNDLIVSGQLDLNGACPVSGQPVSIFRTKPDGSRFEIGTATTEPDGSFTFADTPDVGGTFSYEAAWEGSANRTSSISDPVSVLVRVISSLDISVGASSVQVDDDVVISGTLDLKGLCPDSGQTVSITRTAPDGSRFEIGTATTQAGGTFSFVDRPDTGGTFTYEAAWEGSENCVSSISDPVSVLVRVISSLDISVGASSVRVDDDVVISGTLDLKGFCPDSGQTVSITRTAPDGSRFEIGTATTQAAGSFSFVDRPDTGGTFTYEAAWEGSENCVSSISDPVSVLVERLDGQLSLISGDETIEHGVSTYLLADILSNDPQNRIVHIYQTPGDGSRSLLTTAATDSDGRVLVWIAPKVNTEYEAVWDGDARNEPATPVAITVDVRPAVKGATRGGFKVAGGVRLYHAGQKALFALDVRPAHAGDRATVTVQARRGGRWKTIRTIKPKLNKKGEALVRIPSILLGQYRVRASFPGDADHSASTGDWHRYKVTL